MHYEGHNWNLMGLSLLNNGKAHWILAINEHLLIAACNKMVEYFDNVFKDDQELEM